jgi:hypothetical protein
MSSNHNFPLFVIGTHWLSHYSSQRGRTECAIFTRQKYSGRENGALTNTKIKIFL